jgi:hypothetical protein
LFYSLDSWFISILESLVFVVQLLRLLQSQQQSGSCWRLRRLLTAMLPSFDADTLLSALAVACIAVLLLAYLLEQFWSAATGTGVGGGEIN